MGRHPTSPPRILERLVGALVPPEARETVLGDLHEDWGRMTERRGSLQAAAWYVGAGLAVGLHYARRGLLSPDGGRGDLRTGLRRLRRTPGFTLLALTGVGLGVGANAVTLSVADAVLLAPLPFPASERLGLLTYDFSGSESDGFGIAWRDLEALRERSATLERVTGVLDWRQVDLTGDGEARRVAASFVGPGYLELLGAEAVRGRTFTDGENAPGAGAPVALLSRAFWIQALGGEPDVVGRSLTLNGVPVTVVGILRGEAHDLRQRFDRPADVYLPLFAAEAVLEEDLREERGEGPLNALVRLRPGATAAELRTELTRISGELAGDFPDTNEGWTLHFEPLEEVFYRDVRTPVAVLLAGALLIFLLVAFNLGGLVLVRGLGRRREAAIRRVLGAPPGRNLRLSLVETSLLAVGGGLLGLGLGRVGVAALAGSPLLALPSFAPVRLTPGAVAASLLFVGLLAVGLGLAGAAPLGRGASHPAQGARTTSGPGTRRARALLVVSELGMALALLVVSGLLLRSLAELRTTDMGFDPDGLLTLKLELRGERYDEPDARRAAADELVARAGAVPGVTAAFLWSPNGVGEGSWVDLLTREDRWDRHPAERLEASRHHVLPGALERAGIEVLRGRDVGPGDDAESPEVALVSESLAEHLWPGEDPIGRRLESRPGGELRVREVVGVVEDARHRSRLADPFGPQLDVYYAFRQRTPRRLTLAARLAPGADPGSVVSGLRAVVADLDPALPAWDVTTMEERMRREEARTRLTTFVVLAYGLLAAVLASLGIYGVLAQGVRDRTREIGVRLALGADTRAVMAAVAGTGIRALAGGAVLGILMVWAAHGLVSGILYGVSLWDPAALIGALALLAVVGTAATAVPALRAAGVEPAEVLKEG